MVSSSRCCNDSIVTCPMLHAVRPWQGRTKTASVFCVQASTPALAVPKDQTVLKMPSVDFSDPMEVVLGPPEVGHVAELRQQLADAQSTRFGLDRQLSELCRHMGPDDVQPGSSSRSEKSDHMTFEQALAAHLDDTGDSAVPHVAATYKACIYVWCKLARCVTPWQLRVLHGG